MIGKIKRGSPFCVGQKQQARLVSALCVAFVRPCVNPSVTAAPCHLPLIPKGGSEVVLLHTVVPLIKRLLFHKGGARSARPVGETGRSRRSPEGVEGRGQREALRSPGIPGQRSAGRYEDPNEAGSAASELASVGGREAAGAPRTRSEAKSAGAEHRASVSAGRCEGVGRPC